MKFTARKLAAAAAGCVLVMVSMTTTPVQADTAPQARFSVKSVSTQDIKAQATAVAIAGADAIGKTLLEEVRATAPQNVQKRMQMPTLAETHKYGTIAHSNSEAQSMLAKQVKVYDQTVKNAQVKVGKLKIKLQHADTRQERVKLKRQLRAANRHLHTVLVDPHWRYRPLIGLPEGVCFRNTGANNHMNLDSFVECTGAHKDHAINWLGFDQVEREMRVVAFVDKEGNIHEGCLNFAYFVIPPGTPDETLFIILRSFATAIATVSLDYDAKIELVMHGELDCGDGNIVTKDQGKVFNAPTVHLTKTVKSPKSVDEAIQVGEGLAKADASAEATAQSSIVTTKQQEITDQMTLVCPNKPPTGEIVDYPRHLYEGGYYRVKVVGSDRENGANVNVSYTVTGAASIATDAEHPQNCDAEGTNQTCTFWVVAGNSPGNATINLVVTDLNGAKFTQSVTFPVLEPQL